MLNGSRALPVDSIPLQMPSFVCVLRLGPNRWVAAMVSPTKPRGQPKHDGYRYELNEGCFLHVDSLPRLLAIFVIFTGLNPKFSGLSLVT